MLPPTWHLCPWNMPLAVTMAQAMSFITAPTMAVSLNIHEDISLLILSFWRLSIRTINNFKLHVVIHMASMP